jgi:hypothetical protein
VGREVHRDDLSRESSRFFCGYLEGHRGAVHFGGCVLDWLAGFGRQRSRQFVAPASQRRGCRVQDRGPFEDRELAHEGGRFDGLIGRQVELGITRKPRPPHDGAVIWVANLEWLAGASRLTAQEVGEFY